MGRGVRINNVVVVNITGGAKTMPYSERWAVDVRAAMKDKSQAEVARAIGVSAPTVSNMAYGRIPEDISVVRRFAEAIGQDPDAWERRVQLYSSEVYLRAQGDLSDDTIAEILDLINRDKEAANKQRR